jgi:sugar lactone lactonase YvrE
MGLNPLDGWQVDRASIGYAGTDLQRPECVLAEADGTLWCSDARGGVMRVNPDGRQVVISPDVVEPGPASLPNGIGLASNGDLLLANWGKCAIERMSREGRVTSLCTAIDGRPLGKANFVLRDSQDRVWFTVTTREEPWTRQLQSKASDGYIGVIDERGPRIVADGFCGTNEIRFDLHEQWLYVVESTGWRISRLRVGPDATLTDREVFGPSELPGIPDGFAFDSFGNLWVTLTMADRLIALTSQGTLLTLLDDGDARANAVLRQHFDACTLTPELMERTHGQIAPWMASIAFGGPDLRTVYLGSVLGTRIPFFRSPVAGLPMLHWSSKMR